MPTTGSSRSQPTIVPPQPRLIKAAAAMVAATTRAIRGLQGGSLDATRPPPPPSRHRPYRRRRRRRRLIGAHPSHRRAGEIHDPAGPSRGGGPPQTLGGMFEVGKIIRHGATGVVHYGRCRKSVWLTGEKDPAMAPDHAGGGGDSSGSSSGSSSGGAGSGGGSDEWFGLVLKVELVDAERQQMTNEWRVYQALSTSGLRVPVGTGGFPAARFLRDPSFRMDGAQLAAPVHVLAMEGLGDNLEQLRLSTRAEKLGLNSVLGLGEQMVELVAMLHSTGYAHRDIKVTPTPTRTPTPTQREHQHQHQHQHEYKHEHKHEREHQHLPKPQPKRQSSPRTLWWAKGPTRTGSI